MSEQTPKNPNFSRGKRYSPGQKVEILKDADLLTVAQAAKKHGCTPWSIYNWRNQKARGVLATEPKLAGEAGSQQTEPPSLSATQEERHQLILALWKQQPGLGPSQIRNQLKRKGYKASVKTVREIMEDHGYIQPKARRKEHTGRYEAIRPLQLVHLDFYHFYVHRQKQCLLLILDDYSRFITGWTLLKSEAADGVIDQFEKSITRFGKPEAVMSDRGSAFHSWRGLSRFERLLEEYGIDYYLAKEAAVNGKVEALNASVQKELVRQMEFVDLSDCNRQTARWVEFYNYKRTHHALGGLLVPADRFHGWSEQTLKRIEQGHGADSSDLLDPSSRPLELFKVVSVAGQPAIYLMGKKVLG